MGASAPTAPGKSAPMLYGTSPLIVVARIWHIPSVSVESHEEVDKISAYVAQRRAVSLRQLILVLHVTCSHGCASYDDSAVCYVLPVCG